MNKMYDKETLSFYLVAVASAMAAIAAMCTSAFWRATGGVAVGFALFLPALVLAALGFSYPSPLNKVRAAVMLGNTLALSAIFVCLFIARDLAGAKIVLYTVAGVFQPNAMGVLLTIFMGFGLLVAVMTAARVLMQAFGKSMNDLERQLYVQSAAETETPAPDITPREVDEKQVLAKADQEVRMNRLSILPASSAPDGRDRTPVSPAEARARSQARREEEEAEEEAPVRARMATITTETPAPVYSAPQAEPTSEEAPVRSILAEEEPTADAPQADEDVIYAQTDDVEPAVEVEMAKGQDLTDYDIRTETAVHRPRQKEMPKNDDLYTDFSYDEDDDVDPTDAGE